MKKHLFLLILALAVLSVSNVWGGDTYIFPVTPASTCSGGTLSQDANGYWYYEMSDASDYVEIQFAVTELQTYLVKVGCTTSVTGATCNLQYYIQGGEVGNYQFGMGHGASVSDVITEVNCGAQLTSDKLHPDNQFKPPYAVRVHPAQDKTMRVYYLKLEGVATGSQTTETIPSSLNLVFTSTVNYNMISNSDFLYTRKEGDQVKAYDKESTRRITFKNGIVAASRKLYTFETGTYKFTFHAWSDVSHSDYKAPYVFINGVVAGASDFSINKDVQKSHDIEVEIDVTAGTYPVEFYFPDSYDEQLFYTTVSVEKKATSACPSAYSFTYKNGSSAWSDPVCFTNTGTSDGYVGYYWTAECTLPTDGVSFKLGWEGTDNAANAKTVEVDFSYMPYDLQRTKTFGVHPTSSNTGGAEGYLRVRSSYNDDNKYIGFIPAGYVLRTGSGESWSSINFVPASEDYDETDWSTPLTTLSSSTAAKHYYVGLKTSSGYVWSNAYSEDWSRLIFLQTKGSSTSGWRADNAKMQLHYWKNGGGVDAYITMTDDDGDGVYEAWLPNVSYDRIQFKRLNSGMTETWNQTGDLEFQSDKNMYIIEENFSETGWGVYDQAGKFHIYANSSDKNWYLRFKPHFVLTYDANGGSGAPDEQSVAIDAVSKSVTVAAGSGMTAPTGYVFDHWDTQYDDNGTNYDPGDSYTLSSDATLYAQWTAKQSTITFDKEGGSSGSDGATGTYGSAMPSITAPTRTGYDFGGYWDGDNGTGNQYYKADGTSYAIWNKDTEDGTTLYAKWTAKDYTVTYSDPENSNSYTISVAGGSAGSENKTAHYGNTVTLTASAYTGYTFSSWAIKKTSDNSDVTTSVGLSGTTTATFTMPDYGVTVVATFNVAATYSVTVNRNNDSYGTVTGAGSYASGETVNITATPAGGYEFVNWETSDGVTFDDANNASTSFTMIGSAVTVQANFRAETCVSDIIIECEDDDYLIVPTAAAQSMPTHYIKGNDNYYSNFNGKYIEHKDNNNVGYDGEMYYLIYIPKDASYTFKVRVASNKEQYFNIYSTDGTYNQSQYVTYGGVTYYKKQDGNAVGNSTSDGDHYFRDVTACTISLSAGNYVIGLYGKGWATWDQIKIHDNSTYHVQWAAGDEHTGGFASVQTSSGAIAYNDAVPACTNVTFTANAMATGYVLSHWEVNGVRYPTYDGLYTFNIDVNRDINVTVHSTTASAYAVTVNSNNDSYGSAVADAATYASGATVTLTATPNSGYGFVNWTASDEVTFVDANSASTTFAMPSKNVTVTANFAPLRTVNYEVVGGHGSISAAVKATGAPISSGAQVPEGTEVTFTATPSPGYSVMGWYTWIDPTETRQGETRSTAFDYEVRVNITIRVKFVPIMIALGDNNVGANEGEFQYRDGSDETSSLTAETVTDPDSRFGHKVLKYTYNIKTTNCYRGITLPEDAGYSTSIATGATGIGFWYRTESTTDNVLMYFKVYTDSWKQKMVYLPATNQVWTYFYFENSDVASATGFGFYINEQGDGKNTAVIGSNGHFWLSEVKPLTISDVTVNSNEEKPIPMVVRDLTIYQGGQVTNEDDILITRNIYYYRPAKDDGTAGKLGNKLDQWYTFALPFTVSDVEVYDEADKAWFDINAVYYSSDDMDQATNNPNGAGHYYLQYLKAENETAIGRAFAARWQYITPGHSEYIHADTYNEDRYGYPKKDSAYIILFDSDQPIGSYFQTNTQIRFVGGPQTIDGVAKEWKIESDGEQYWMYANNTLHSFTLTDAYILNGDGTKFVLQDSPRIRPFECYVQATASLKEKCAAISMRGFRIDNTTTGAESIQGSAIRAEKILRNGQLIIIRNGVEYDATGVVIR